MFDVVMYMSCNVMQSCVPYFERLNLISRSSYYVMICVNLLTFFFKLVLFEHIVHSSLIIIYKINCIQLSFLNSKQTRVVSLLSMQRRYASYGSMVNKQLPTKQEMTWIPGMRVLVGFEKLGIMGKKRKNKGQEKIKREK